MIEKKISLIILIVIASWIMGESMASDVDIDYSHKVAGTGTVMTDFEMGSLDSTKAIGVVHGTGEVMNKYLFLSNNSENVTILDQFLFTKAQPSIDTSIERYPRMERKEGSFRLLGTDWSGNINSFAGSFSPQAKDL